MIDHCSIVAFIACLAMRLAYGLFGYFGLLVWSYVSYVTCVAIMT